ncbi:MAG: DMT family transporter [Ottowia sp.]|uniref:DMT family transporter n=1 Tax=Ottowia sp. TaxID=1898956 RepID=UPI001DDB430A|nr:DMT family transporter [Ottowia sp.]
MRQNASAAPAVLALLLNAAVWGLSWLPFKALAARGLHPLWTTAAVFTASLALLLWTQRGHVRQALADRRLWWLALAAGCTNVGFNWAVTVGDVVRVVLLFYLMPVWSVGLAWWLLGEAPTRMALLRLVLALAGVALVLGRPGMPWPVPESLSDWLALAAGASFALTNALLRRWRDTPSGARALAMFGGGAVTASAVALGATALGLTGAVPTPTSAWLPWLALLMAGFLASNLALQYGAARLPAQTTALIMLSEVVIASAAAVALGAARLEATTLLGGLLIVGAALLAVARR